MSGLLIAVEGIDKSGKETQVNELAKRFILEGKQVITIDFPSYDTPSGQAIRAILDGFHGISPEDSMELQSLMAINMYEQQMRIEHALMSDKVVICDRYLHSRLVFGVARGLDRTWLEQTSHSMVQPDQVILLDISEEEYQRRSSNYEHLDIHEKDFSFLRNVSMLYRTFAKEYGWIQVSGEGDIDEISKEIYISVKKFIAETEE